MRGLGTPTEYLNGIKGIQSHLVGKHDERLTLLEVIARCNRTELSEVDTQRVRNGQLPLVPIEMFATRQKGKASSRLRRDERASTEEYSPRDATSRTAAKGEYANSVANSMSHPLWPSVHANYPMIIRAFGEVFAAACPECGANAKASRCSAQRGGRFMAGLKGLMVHMQRLHPEYKISTERQVIELCKRTPICASDLKLIMLGQVPRIKIPVRHYEPGNDDSEPDLDEDEVADSDSDSDDDPDAMPLSQLLRNTTTTSSSMILRAPLERFQIISEDYPTIVLADGSWWTLSCGRCGTNATCKHPSRPWHLRFIRGIIGLYSHYRQVHTGEQGWSYEQVFSACKRERVEPAVASRVFAGDKTVLQIKKNLGTDVIRLLAVAGVATNSKLHWYYAAKNTTRGEAHTASTSASHQSAGAEDESPVTSTEAPGTRDMEDTISVTPAAAHSSSRPTPTTPNVVTSTGPATPFSTTPGSVPPAARLPTTTTVGYGGYRADAQGSPSPYSTHSAKRRKIDH